VHVVGKEQSPQQDISNHDILQAQQQQPMPAPYPYTLQTPTFDTSPHHQSFIQFSTLLPTESQLLPSSALDSMNPYTSFLTLGGEVTQQPFYSYKPNLNPTFKSERSRHPSAASIHQTSAPGSALGLLEASTISATANSNPSSATTDGIATSSTSTSTYGSNFDGTFGDILKAPALTWNNNVQGSGGVTPTGNGDWISLIEGWEEPIAA